MELFLFIFCLISSFIFPLVGVIVSGVSVATVKKQSRVLLILFVLVLGYIFSFYLPSYTDDMTRYIGYMSSISGYTFIGFIKQLFSPQPINIYGLNGQEWPGSAVLLFIAAKLGSYRILSALTLIFTYIVRLKFIQDSWTDSKKQGYYILWFLIIILWVRPLLPLSGFRWFIAISCIMLSLSFENRYGFKKRYIFLYLLAALFHPGSIIFSGLRFVSFLFNLNRKRTIIFLSISIILLFVASRNQLISAFVQELLSHFSEYSDNEWNKFQSISRILSATMMALLLARSFSVLKSAQITIFERRLLVYLNIQIIFNLCLIWHPSFNRLSQFTIVIGLLLLSKSYFNKDKREYKDLLIPAAAVLIGLILMFYYPKTSFPDFIEPLTRILVSPIHFT